MKNFETLEIGKSYKKRLGEIVKIVGPYDHELYQFQSDDGDLYMHNGQYYADREDYEDLIELIEDSQKRPHADLIIQWANDKNIEIEVKRKDQEEWIVISCPNWDETLEYRIKPKLIEKFLFVYQLSDGKWYVSDDHYSEKEATEKFKVTYQKIEESKITVEI